MLVGLLWLLALRWKLPPSFDGGSQRGLREWLELEVTHAAFEPYGRLIDSVVLPNFTLFAWALFLTELMVGLSLLLGVGVRIGSLVGLALSVNLGIGLLDVPGEWPWAYAMLAMWHGLFYVSNAGRVWGLDGRLGLWPERTDSKPTQPLETSPEGLRYDNKLRR
ncbi:MAG: DoxX family membrane protein [Acidimicrobiales bacterium]